MAAALRAAPPPSCLPRQSDAGPYCRAHSAHPHLAIRPWICTSCPRGKHTMVDPTRSSSRLAGRTTTCIAQAPKGDTHSTRPPPHLSRTHGNKSTPLLRAESPSVPTQATAVAGPSARPPTHVLETHNPYLKLTVPSPTAANPTLPERHLPGGNHLRHSAAGTQTGTAG